MIEIMVGSQPGRYHDSLEPLEVGMSPLCNMIITTGYAYMEVDVGVVEDFQRLKIVLIDSTDAFKSTVEKTKIEHTTQSVGTNVYVPAETHYANFLVYWRSSSAHLLPAKQSPVRDELVKRGSMLT